MISRSAAVLRARSAVRVRVPSRVLLRVPSCRRLRALRLGKHADSGHTSGRTHAGTENRSVTQRNAACGGSERGSAQSTRVERKGHEHVADDDRRPGEDASRGVAAGGGERAAGERGAGKRAHRAHRDDGQRGAQVAAAARGAGERAHADSATGRTRAGVTQRLGSPGFLPSRECGIPRTSAPEGRGGCLLSTTQDHSSLGQCGVWLEQPDTASLSATPDEQGIRLHR